MLSCQLLFLTPDFLISNIITFRSSGAFSLWRAPTGTSSMSQPSLENIYHYKQILLPRGFLLILRVVSCACVSVPVLIKCLKPEDLKTEEVGGSRGCLYHSSLCPGAQVWLLLQGLSNSHVVFWQWSFCLGHFWRIFTSISNFKMRSNLFTFAVPRCSQVWSPAVLSFVLLCPACSHLTLWKNIENPPLLMRGGKHRTN